jgi:3-deoxy-manno-octulosonate cytidylyltransferase (CMP-KDO synthetase)
MSLESLKVAVMIPSRLGAQRLPNKPLALIDDKPMVVHVWEKALASRIGPVFVVTPDEEIRSVIEDRGGKVIMTSHNPITGSDRVFEACQQIAQELDIEIAINLQGDLPIFPPKALVRVLDPFKIDPSLDISTLIYHAPKGSHHLSNPSIVKVAFSPYPQDPSLGKCLYFSRSAMDSVLCHVGIYAYRLQSLKRFAELPQGILELKESLEQLRALENGMAIGAAIMDGTPIFCSIDTPADLARTQELVALLKEDAQQKLSLSTTAP